MTVEKDPLGSTLYRVVSSPHMDSRVLSSCAARPHAALSSLGSTICEARRPSRKVLIVPKCPLYQMWKASFRRFVSRTLCSSSADISDLRLRWSSTSPRLRSDTVRSDTSDQNRSTSPRNASASSSVSRSSPDMRSSSASTACSCACSCSSSSFMRSTSSAAVETPYISHTPMPSSSSTCRLAVYACSSFFAALYWSAMPPEPHPTDSVHSLHSGISTFALSDVYWYKAAAISSALSGVISALPVSSTHWKLLSDGRVSLHVGTSLNGLLHFWQIMYLRTFSGACAAAAGAGAACCRRARRRCAWRWSWR
eukprot:Rhum_TRINITY_DN14121_c23_g1::Rhum_TRINITY_DN14121_c23_g1_i1::g.71429::m.71429